AANIACGGESKRQSKRLQLDASSKTVDVESTLKLGLEKKIAVEAAEPENVHVHQRCVVGTGDAQAEARHEQRWLELECVVEEKKRKAVIRAGTIFCPTVRRSEQCAEHIGANWKIQFAFQSDARSGIGMDEAELKRRRDIDGRRQQGRCKACCYRS